MYIKKRDIIKAINEVKTLKEVQEAKCNICGEKCSGDADNAECNHGCEDCGYFDGNNCLNPQSNYYGCDGGICAADCINWEGGE